MWTKVTFILNHKKIQVEGDSRASLADVLRNRLGLLGTKEACRQGECGACTVIVDGDAVASCIYPFPKVEGREVLTIEGLEQNGELEVIQKCFMENGAIQCGFCTPGMIMSAKALLDKNSDPNREEIKRALSGNICRCTGYKKIVDAVEDAANVRKELLYDSSAKRTHKIL